MESIGVNTKLIGSFYDGIKEVIDALQKGSHSSESDKCDLNEIVDRYLAAAEAYVRSQPGLKDVPQAKQLRADPRNAEFFVIYEDIKVYTQLIKKNPTAATKSFNSQTAESYARFTVLMMEVSARAV